MIMTEDSYSYINGQNRYTYSSTNIGSGDSTTTINPYSSFYYSTYDYYWRFTPKLYKTNKEEIIFKEPQNVLKPKEIIIKFNPEVLEIEKG
jgi:hypothetical protein